MAVKWSTPGIGYSEVDNTVRANAQPGDGIGAFVFNANRGYPNQRVLCTSIDKFHEYFGTPDDPNQYGHFAAQVYFEQGGATQLLAVRATQGDEGYAQIQYPYTDSINKQDLNKIHQRLDFVDNSLFDNLKIVEPITPDDIDANTRDKEGFKGAGFDDNEGVFELRAKSKVGNVKDIFNSAYETGDIYVYRDTQYADSVIGSAYYDGNGDAMFAVTSGDITLTSGNTFNQSLTSAYAVNDEAYYETVIKIDSSVSLSGETLTQKVYSKKITETSKKLSEIMDISQMPQKMDVEVQQVNKLTLVDWDDSLTKTFIVKSSEWSSKEVKALQFTEYGTADSKFVLVRSEGLTARSCKGADEADLRVVADEYGLQIADINNDRYAILKYKLAKDEDFENPETQIVLAVVDKSKYGTQPSGSHVVSLANAALAFEYTWSLFKEINKKNIQIAPTYGSPVTESIIKPWQIGDVDSDVNPLVAISSTEVFSDPTGIWKDGYTPSCKNDGEPGNGDIESYQSNKENQLVIAAIGPGEFGNDIGISVITPEAAKIPALYGPNAFSWLYRYDDEDKVNEDGLDYTQNPNNLTWKKVYKINVYVKAKSKTAAVWGFGLDALSSSPVESWLVSNDPTAKDENGNSLWAPYVINGNSNYIYVSKKSVEAAKDERYGGYSMPEMTWSIYQMTGGTNSKLNNVKEKTKALDLFKNRKKANLDYLFNVEPIDTFSGKQKYMAMQNRIGQLASSRKMDLGIIQCTSKEAKTIRLKLSEGKMFSFADGSYVAGYDDYDSYFDPFTSTWVMLPKSVAGAVACCYCDNYIQPWMAPAGTTQGQIRYSDRTMVRLDDDEFGQLYDIHVNASMFFQGSGECLMGQKTMLKKESALNRIDVRKLCNFIEKRLDNKLTPYLYRKNTSTERSSMKTAVDTFIGRIQSAGGIISRKVEVIPDETDTHLVYVKISFVPAESIERIEVVLVLNRQTGTITPSESVVRI